MTLNYTYHGRHRATANTRTRRIAVTGVFAATLAGLGAAPAMASPASDANDLQSQARELVSDLQSRYTDGVLNVHDAAQEQADQVPNQFRDVYEQGLTDVTNTLAPGALDQRAAERAAAAAAAAEQARRNAWNNTSNTPCPATAKACVDLNGRRSWLQSGNKTVYGPVFISSGAPGADTATPRGSFHVTYKVKDEISREFNNAPMPYAVYFTWSGHAFHLGDPRIASAGCIHLSDPDAIAFFDALQPGDEVFIY